MTKFFAQLLLSLMVGFGAAATFDADVKDALAQSLDRTRAFVQDATHTGFERTGRIDLTAEAETDDRGQAEAELGVDVEVESEADTRLNRLFRGISKWFGEANAETTLTAESETDAEADAGEASLDLGNDLESDLELDFGLGD